MRDLRFAVRQIENSFGCTWIFRGNRDGREMLVTIIEATRYKYRWRV
jgi:hypothetical protein